MKGPTPLLATKTIDLNKNNKRDPNYEIRGCNTDQIGKHYNASRYRMPGRLLRPTAAISANNIEKAASSSVTGGQLVIAASIRILRCV